MSNDGLSPEKISSTSRGLAADPLHTKAYAMVTWRTTLIRTLDTHSNLHTTLVVLTILGPTVVTVIVPFFSTVTVRHTVVHDTK